MPIWIKLREVFESKQHREESLAQMAQGLKRAFPLPAKGAFSELLGAINDGEAKGHFNSHGRPKE